MNTGIVSARYAKAIYDFALEKGEETLVYDSFAFLLENFLAFPELNAALKNPTLSFRQKFELLSSACGSTTNETMDKIIHLLLKRGRGDYVQNIALVYQTYYRKRKGRVIAHLTSVEPLSQDLKNKMVAIISRMTDNEVEFHVKTDPEIVGGFVLEIEDQRLDASIKDQLNRLRLDLIN